MDIHQLMDIIVVHAAALYHSNTMMSYHESDCGWYPMTFLKRGFLYLKGLTEKGDNRWLLYSCVYSKCISFGRRFTPVKRVNNDYQVDFS